MRAKTTSGEDWDICFTSYWAFNYANNARLGLFHPLNELLKKYGSGIENCLAEMPMYIDAAKIGGEAYAVTVYNGGGYWQAYYFDKRNIDKYGFDLSAVKTIDDLFPLFDKAKADNPGMVAIENYGWLGGDIYDYIIDTDFPGAVRIDDNSCRVINQYEDPQYMALLKKFRYMYQKGYTFKDAVTERTPADMLRTGKILSMIDKASATSAVDWTSAPPYMPTVVVPVFPVPVAKSPEVCMAAMMAINSQSKHPEEAMQFINLLYSDKYLLNLLVNGIEGVHYQKVSENRIKTISDRYSLSYSWVFGYRCLLYVDQALPENKWEIYKNCYKNAIKSPLFGFIIDTRPIAGEISAMRNVVEEYAKSVKRGSVDPEKAVPEFSAKLKAAGLEKYLTEIQKQIDVWKKNK
jgi:putative aldouronate transport system substrate-binding protein